MKRRWPKPTSAYVPRPSRQQRTRSSAAEQEGAELRRRQVRATQLSALATVLLSAALVLLSYLQWNTSESTARIERAKAQPHFRVRQTPYEGLSGFLPAEFAIDAVAGVADASESSASEIFLIHYSSKQLGLHGMCRASSTTFYGDADDMMSYAISDGTQKLIQLSSASQGEDERFTIQPMQTMIDTSFTDIFGEPQRRYLLLMGGRSSQVPLREFSSWGWTNMALNYQLESGELIIFRVNDGPIPQECADALRVLSMVKGIRIVSHFVIPATESNLIWHESAYFRPGDPAITTTNPVPRYLPEYGKGPAIPQPRAGTAPSYALSSMVPVK
jgi:hypothetical protein